MIWDIISKKLSDAGLGVEGETMFEKRFPADADIGIGFFEPLGGIVVDPHRPGFFKPELQIIVRHKNITEGTELAKAVMKTLTVKGEEFYPANAERGAVMDNIQVALNREANKYGAEIIDVRIKRADLPEGATLEAAYNRMRTARQQEAISIRAEGQKEAQIIRGGADGEAARIYAASFGKDPEFYDFYRAMQSYRQTFLGENNQGGTSIVMSADNEYLKRFRGN